MSFLTDQSDFPSVPCLDSYLIRNSFSGLHLTALCLGGNANISVIFISLCDFLIFSLDSNDSTEFSDEVVLRYK